jgi:hypothetical protein
MDQYSAQQIANALNKIGNALATMAIEYKRANDIKESEIRHAAAAKRLGNQGFG